MNDKCKECIERFKDAYKDSKLYFSELKMAEQAAGSCNGKRILGDCDVEFICDCPLVVEFAREKGIEFSSKYMHFKARYVQEEELKENIVDPKSFAGDIALEEVIKQQEKEIEAAHNTAKLAIEDNIRLRQEISKLPRHKCWCCDGKGYFNIEGEKEEEEKDVPD